MLLHGATKLWGAWRGIFEWLDTGGGGIAGRRHLGLVGVHLWERTRTTPIGGGFVIEVLVIAAAQIQHRVKSVYMDYLLDVPPAGPPFQRLVARGVGASPALVCSFFGAEEMGFGLSEIFNNVEIRF